MTTEAQNNRVLRHLRTGRPLSPLIALERYGIMRLAARIYDLKSQGVKIETHAVRFGKKRWASYLISI